MANVKEEVFKAYSDSSPSDAQRDLNFLASDTVQPDWATKIMQEATPRGYNRFRPEAIKTLSRFFKGEPEIILARESSVCVYAIGELREDVDLSMGGLERQEIEVDEHHEYTGEEMVQKVRDRQEYARENDHARGSESLSRDLQSKLESTNKTVHRFWWD